MMFAMAWRIVANIPFELLSKPRPSVEPIPELPVFTSGIRGSRPSSASAISLEQSDDASVLPIQTIQQPHIVHAQSIHTPLLQQQQQGLHEVKPVSEENEKDEDVVQVIANLGAVSSFGTQGNLLTPTASPTPSSTISSFLHQQQERQHERQQERQQERQSERQQQYDRQQERQEHQQERLQERQHQTERQQERQQNKHDRLVERQQERLQERQQQQLQAIQYRPITQQHIQPVQYRPTQQPISRSSVTPAPETQAIHQIITPVQYRPQKPIRLQKQPQPQQQQFVERNEYDLNEARPVVKQRAQVAPKKSKPQSDYYEGRTKKPVAQVIRRYREEMADGSIIWGFENDDGSFKEEIIGIDCITRGKYGYVDPDGLRREYTYETGIKCDEESQQQDQDILNTFVDYQENKLVLPSGKTIDLSSMGKKQARRPQPLYRN